VLCRYSGSYCFSVLCWTSHHATRCSHHLSYRTTDTPHVADSCRLQTYSRGIRLISPQIESNSLRAISCQRTVTDNDRAARMSRIMCRKRRIAVSWRNAVKWRGHCRDGKLNCYYIFCTLKMEAPGCSEAFISTKVYGVMSK
jgi:hypothetical protein